MVDRLGVTNYPVAVSLPQKDPKKTKILTRLATMEREAMHLLTAVRDMRNGILRSDSQLFVSGVTNSRNWTLSVLMSHIDTTDLKRAKALLYDLGLSTKIPKPG